MSALTTLPTVVSYFTPNWEYPAHAARLRASCESLGLPHVIEELPDQGAWRANGRLKPAFILEKMEELQRPLLWTDVDNEFLAVPTGLRADVDFMAVARKGTRFRRRSGWAWCVWVMLFNPTPGTMKLLRWWVDDTSASTDSDDRSFERVWRQHRSELKGAALPSECANEDSPTVRWGCCTWSSKMDRKREVKKMRQQRRRARR